MADAAIASSEAIPVSSASASSGTVQWNMDVLQPEVSVVSKVTTNDSRGKKASGQKTAAKKGSTSSVSTRSNVSLEGSGEPPP